MTTDDPRIRILDTLIKRGQEVAKTRNPDPDLELVEVIAVNPISFASWVTQVEQFFMDYIDERNAYVDQFNSMIITTNRDYQRVNHVLLGVRLLQDLMQYLIENPTYSKTKKRDSVEQIELICDRFHLMVRQLRRRYKSRTTLDVEDEYDVQDFLHTLLLQFFDDIRPEEPTPSYAGGSGRMDFLLKDERIVIETKITRKGKGTEDKRIGDELLQDVDRYNEHPDCSTLICFVYDPDGRIGNPTGLIADLEKKNRSDLRVIVFIKP